MTRIRKVKGSAIAEFGPAMFVLFIVLIFPFIDILELTFAYSLCWFVNYQAGNEVARSKQANWGSGRQTADGTAIGTIVSNVMQSGFATFLHLQKGSVLITAIPGNTAANTAAPTVTVTSQITVQPFISVPWFSAVPGLNAPLTFTIASQLTREITL